MSGGHAHALFLHGDSPIHRLAPQVKILGAVALVFSFVATPRDAYWAFGIYAALVVTLMFIARIPPAFVMRRMAIEIPFLFVALLLPLFGGGPTVDFLGMTLSQAGLGDAWNILAKATLGLAVAVILGATTQIPDILAGLDGLRMPSVVTAIAGFMVRYIDVIVSDWSRMRIAMASRGHDPRWFTQVAPLARTVGIMFIRTYERGERVYLAMRSRGYTGTMPASALPATPRTQWITMAVLVVSVAGIATIATVGS